jgi:hypothetical protein
VIFSYGVVRVVFGASVLCAHAQAAHFVEIHDPRFDLRHRFEYFFNFFCIEIDFCVGLCSFCLSSVLNPEI